MLYEVTQLSVTEIEVDSGCVVPEPRFCSRELIVHSGGANGLREGLGWL